MMFFFILGLFFGFFIAFFVLKYTINKSGYGELKMCREKCPYYRAVEISTDGSDEEEEEGE